MNWGVWNKKLSSSEMIHLMNVCIENKITTFDHADIYGDYTTESDFGKALASSKIAREKMQLMLFIQLLKIILKVPMLPPL